jgi:hypothetical protein
MLAKSNPALTGGGMRAGWASGDALWRDGRGGRDGRAARPPQCTQVATHHTVAET